MNQYKEENKEAIKKLTILCEALSKESPILFTPILRSILRDLCKVYQNTESEEKLKTLLAGFNIDFIKNEEVEEELE